MLLLVLIAQRAFCPIAVLKFPVTFVNKALQPMATLFVPLVLRFKEQLPTAVLTPVVLAFRAA